jgi:hypothetical protein
MPSRWILSLVFLVSLAGCDTAGGGDGTLSASGLLVGERVALDGEVALLGAPGSNEAFFFDRELGTWSAPVTRRPTAARVPDPFYGQFIALRGDVAVVGAPESVVALDAAGHAYIYARSGGAWTEAAVLRPEDLTANGGFGLNVAVSEGRVAVAAGNDGCVTLETRGCGRVHLFEQRAGWSRTAVLSTPDPDEVAFFGGNVALDGGRLVVLASAGEFGVDGRLYVFEQDGASGWSVDDVIDAPPLPFSGRFTPLGYGTDIALDGETLAVSEPGRDEGTVYVYRRGASSWTLEATLTRPRAELGGAATFGHRIDVSGDRLVVAVPGRTYDGRRLGAALVYARGAAGVWTEETELRSAEGVVGFGRDVAISGESVLVGANDSEQNGGGFLFARGPDGWTQVQ